MISAIIVDDDVCFREMIQLLLEDFFPIIKVIAQSDSVEGAVKAIDTYHPDLVFLDIEIKGGTGFQVLEILKNRNFRLIFITAFNEFAIQAIKFSALDYILKPINEFEFKDGVERAIQEIERNERQIPVESLLINSQERKHKKLVLRTSNDIHIVGIEELVRCSADNAYTTFHLNSGEKITVSKGIGEYAELLSGFGFIRSHQSHLVNLDYIKKLDKTDGGSLILKDKSAVPVSTRQMVQVMEILNKL